ncbi:acyltransferase family protein [Longirhabdus pacifica]|uniref:acyltransferase family protein n=1 Tax=Longirhabdus pacifica TaxID=2305227 RepID=UPI0010092003|nr:acyltransferase family protein [Longirhabdus pacifica]
MIKEWNLLRVIACLSIVLLHSTTTTAFYAGHPEIPYYQLVRILLCYATPTFIILSEIILAHRYPQTLPQGFWLKRLKWIYTPFLFFGVVDAMIAYDKYVYTWDQLQQKLAYNLLFGHFEGYFVLIMFQFYVLHYVVTKYKMSMKVLLPISFVLMMVYQYVYHYAQIPFILENKAFFKMPFIAWFGYFSIAFLMGKHYPILSQKLLKWRWLTLIAVLLSVGIIYLSYVAGDVAVRSLRPDIFPLALSVSLAVIAWGQRLPNYNIVKLISNYAFGIYLIHWPVQRYLAAYTTQWFPYPMMQVIGLFFISFIFSMVIIYLLSRLPWGVGSFLIGQVKRDKHSRHLNNNRRCIGNNRNRQKQVELSE